MIYCLNFYLGFLVVLNFFLFVIWNTKNLANLSFKTLFFFTFLAALIFLGINLGFVIKL